MFPVCAECYPALTAEQLEFYISRLVGSWMSEARTVEEIHDMLEDRAAAIEWCRTEKAST